jgi:hypothetical protein
VVLSQESTWQIYVYLYLCNEWYRCKKVKFSLCLTKHHAMKGYWGVEV